MSGFYHGIKTGKLAASISAPVAADSGIHFVVGTAPVQAVGGTVNEAVLCNSYAEAVRAVGYSDDWEKYTLCEEIYAAFVLYGIGPIVLVNVLDPVKHRKKFSADRFALSEERTVLLPREAIAETVEIDGYVEDEDYGLVHTDTALVVEVIEGGKITGDIAELSIGYAAVAPELVTKADVIGGYDVAGNKYKGLELLDSVFPKYGVVPEIILCPGFSTDSEVAAVMSAKTENINGVFSGICIIDADTEETVRHTDVPEWKKKNNITKPGQILVYPKVKLGDRIFHYSTHEACRMTATDAAADMGDGTPCESPSNKSLQIDSMVLADGTEVLLDLTQANYLNQNGIVTALNFIGGYVSWGNSTACYPSNTAMTDYFINISRMFKWVANSVVLSTWSKVDRRLNRRLLESITQSLNQWLNGLASEEKILGGRVEFLEDENQDVDLMAGKATFHIYLTPPSPAQEFEFLLEYDTSYLSGLMDA
ncbi:MAG: phage tail protein [Lachnospiraceae bacterium]|nr:phage tail protein [Lachnospiraceae bacterium]MCM1240443.1 phage tail protein [Lachnospiraceae bacterium]